MTQLLQGLREEWDQAVLADGYGQVAEWCEQEELPFYPIPLFPLWRAGLGFPRLVALLREKKPDVVILHGQWAGPVGAVACRLAGVPRSVYVAHCPAFYHSNRPIRALRNYIAESLPLRWCERTVVLSAGSWRNYVYRRWGPEGRMVRIRNGVDLSRRPGEQAGPAFRAERGWRPEDFHAVFVGRLVDQKRPDWMLRAWQVFLAQSTDLAGRVFLHFLGDGRERALLQDFARKTGLESSVIFEGEQDFPLRWIAGSDLVVMTSLFEGHALVPLEAMLCGKPILAMRADGVEESIEDGRTGKLVAAGDVQGFAAALAELARDPDQRARLGAEASRRAAIWSWHHSLDQYRDLLRLGEHPR